MECMVVAKMTSIESKRCGVISDVRDYLTYGGFVDKFEPNEVNSEAKTVLVSERVICDLCQGIRNALKTTDIAG